MDRKSSCYVYAPGQYVAPVRQIAASSVGITIPKRVARNLKLRPGMEVMVTIEVAEPEQAQAPSEEASE